MADAFASLDLTCDECGDQEAEEPKHGYKVVQQRHLCKACARRIAHAILSDVTAAAVKWPCSQHETKEVELYCNQCQVGICHTCAFTTHSGHKLQEISSIVAETKTKVKEQMENISSKRLEAEEYLGKIGKCTKAVDGHFGALQDKVCCAFKQKSDDLEETQRSKIERANFEAEEQIRKITEQRDKIIDDINKCTKMEMTKLEADRNMVSTDLEDIKTTLCRKTSELRMSTEKAIKNLSAAQAAVQIIRTTNDNQAFIESFAKMQQVTKETLSLTMDTDIVDGVTSMAQKVQFKRDGCGQRIGNIVGKTRSYELIKTIKLPSHITEPFLIGPVGESAVAIKDSTGTSIHTLNVDTGAIEVLIHPEKGVGIWDAIFLADSSIVYSDYKAGVIRVCNPEGKLIKSITSPNDASRYAFLAESRGKVLAADHAEGIINVIDPVSATHLWKIPHQSGRAILSLDTLKSGDIVVRTGPSKITVLDQSGVIKSTISLEEWSRRINCHVGADDMIYVIYRNEPKDDSTGRVSVVSADGATRRENVIEFPTSWLYRYIPRCTVPTEGTIIILNGGVLLVYKETPGIEDLKDSDN